MSGPVILDGAAVAERRAQALADRVREPLGLGIIVATDNPATGRYISGKRKQAERVGYRVTIRELGPDSSQDAVTAACADFNRDPAITGYIVQLPLPDGVDVDAALAAVDPAKDADGLAPANLERLYAGNPGIVPATPKGILTLLNEYDISVTDRPVTVVGQGRLTGRPLAALLEQRGARVTRCDKMTADLAAATRPAEILVVAAGAPGLITADMVADGAVIVDVGVTTRGNTVLGDVDFDGVSPKVSAITPVPGGVGPMTVVSLLENVYELA